MPSSKHIGKLHIKSFTRRLWIGFIIARIEDINISDRSLITSDFEYKISSTDAAYNNSR